MLLWLSFGNHHLHCSSYNHIQIGNACPCTSIKLVICTTCGADAHLLSSTILHYDRFIWFYMIILRDRRSIDITAKQDHWSCDEHKVAWRFMRSLLLNCFQSATAYKWIWYSLNVIWGFSLYGVFIFPVDRVVCLSGFSLSSGHTVFKRNRFPQQFPVQ